MNNLYRPVLRPASSFTLPAGITWKFVEAPWANGPADMPRAATCYGVIETSRELTLEERAHFDLEPVSVREQRLQAAGFTIESTGGGCTAWALPTKDGGYIWITNDASHEIGDTDPVCIGVYNAEGEEIISAWQEAPTDATTPAFALDSVANHVDAHPWFEVLDNEVLAIEANSVCGRLIVELCRDASTLLAKMPESDCAQSVIDAVLKQANVIYYG